MLKKQRFFCTKCGTSFQDLALKDCAVCPNCPYMAVKSKTVTVESAVKLFRDLGDLEIEIKVSCRPEGGFHYSIYAAVEGYHLASDTDLTSVWTSAFATLGRGR